MKLSEFIRRMRAIQDDMHDGGKMMLKCCMCGDVFDIGYEMPSGDYVCATQECCYEYCRCEGKRTTQESED